MSNFQNLFDFVVGFHKIAERKPGRGVGFFDNVDPISSANRPDIWPAVVQYHEAKRAGPHYDLRLYDKKSDAGHSWAIPNWPKNPGERGRAFRTFTHDLGYFGFTGVLTGGYGAGRVGRFLGGPAEVLYSDDKMIRFNMYPGSLTEEFALVRTGPKKGVNENWLVVNVTPSKDRTDIPTSKPAYKEVKPEDVNLGDENVHVQAKIDGAHVTVMLDGGKRMRIFSYRPTERKTGLIQHTYKFPEAITTRTPKEFKNTVLRGELYATDKKGKAIPSNKLSGLLNSGVWKSRLKQKSEDTKLQLAVFDVAQYKGKNYENKAYEEKLKVLEAVTKAIPWLKLPPSADTLKDKLQLVKKIEHGRLPETKEGIVLWQLDKPARPVKVKFKPEYDVRVSKILITRPTAEKRQAAGFYYDVVDDKKLSIIGKIGTGFSFKLKEDMFKDPEKYIGLIAKIEAMGKFESGALRAPSFQGWHLDKNDPVRLQGLVEK